MQSDGSTSRIFGSQFLGCRLVDLIVACHAETACLKRSGWNVAMPCRPYKDMMQGCHTPPPSPHPLVSPLPVKWVVVLFNLVAFPVWSCLASSPPPPGGVGPVVFLAGPAPPVGGSVFYRGSTEVWYDCCRLLVVLNTVIVTSPPPPVGGACGRFGWPRPACVGQCVLQRYGAWLLPLVSSNVIVTCSLRYKI